MPFSFFYGLRIFISLCCAVIIPWYINNITLAVPLILGVVAAGLTDIDDSFRGRLRNLSLTLGCFLIASLSIELLFPYPILMTIGLLLSTFGFILLGALGQRYATIAFGALLIAAYTMLGHDLFQTWYALPLLLLSGALGYNIITLIEHAIFPIRPVQDNLARTFSHLGDYFIAKSALFDPNDDNPPDKQLLHLIELNQSVVAMLNQTRTSLFNRLKRDRGQRNTRRMLSYYFIAQDMHERVSAAHYDYTSIKSEYQYSDIPFRFQQILYRQGLACKEIAESIRHRAHYSHPSRFSYSLNQLDISLQRLVCKTKFDRFLINALTQLLNNLRGIDAQLANIDSEQILSEKLQDNAVVDETITGFRAIFRRFKQEFTPYSPLFRHAVRMSSVLTVDYLIILVTDIPHGYWIILTSLFVCQPNYSATKRRLTLRVIGTIGGILVGIPLLYFVPTQEGQLFLIVVSGVCFFLFRIARYAYATAFITLLTLLCFTLLGEGLTVVFPRIISTLIGCGVAWLAVNFIWPDWRYRTISTLVTNLQHTNSAYFSAITWQYQEGKSNHVDYRLARRNAHTSDIALASTISTMSSEPNANEKQLQDGFKLITLNHTLLSYMSTLGAHRHNPLSADTLSLLTRVAERVTDESTHQAPEKITSLTQQISDALEQNLPQSELLILQQLLLIMAILPKWGEAGRQLTLNRAQT